MSLGKGWGVGGYDQTLTNTDLTDKRGVTLNHNKIINILHTADSVKISSLKYRCFSRSCVFTQLHFYKGAYNADGTNAVRGLGTDHVTLCRQ